MAWFGLRKEKFLTSLIHLGVLVRKKVENRRHIFRNRLSIIPMFGSNLIARDNPDEGLVPALPMAIWFLVDWNTATIPYGPLRKRRIGNKATHI